jgi:hypothetical protein
MDIIIIQWMGVLVGAGFTLAQLMDRDKDEA